MDAYTAIVDSRAIVRRSSLRQILLSNLLNLCRINIPPMNTIL